jgi:hypothetical protein
MCELEERGPERLLEGAEVIVDGVDGEGLAAAGHVALDHRPDLVVVAPVPDLQGHVHPDRGVACEHVQPGVHLGDRPGTKEMIMKQTDETKLYSRI